MIYFLVYKDNTHNHFLHNLLESVRKHGKNMTICVITDSKSKLRNSKLFIEHRHDQSLLSIVLHKYDIVLQFFEKRYLQNLRCPY